ncbi:MAG TPA: adenylate/guanylate cyclase domain-containing protein [Methylophilaceae bacterium]|nr:adenylate/guanylate cyclase domain-containing protein [Methylophilaceae bacterium]
MTSNGFFRRHRIRIVFSLAIVLVFLANAIGSLPYDFTARLENYAYDLRLNWTMPNTQDKRIVIVDIDEKSLKEQGHWPWSRDKLARMVDMLFDRYGIDALGFDVVFAEQDQSSGLQSLEEIARTELGRDDEFQSALNKIRPRLDYDGKFAESLKNRRVALGYYFRHVQSNTGNVGLLPLPLFEKGGVDVDSLGVAGAAGYTANLPELQKSTAWGGYFSVSRLDDDGVFRRLPLIEVHDGAVYESLALAMARLVLNAPVQLGIVEDAGYAELEWLQLGNRHIPVDQHAAALIPYRGMEGSFPYVSASDVLQGRVPPEILKDTIVLVGTTAAGLKDLRVTPVQSVYPGVEVHANMIAGILDQDVKQHPAYTAGADFLFLLFAGLLLALLLPALSPLWATVVTVTVTSLMVAFNLYVWQELNQVLPIASLLLLVAVLFVFNMSYGFFIESRGKRQLAGLFGQYVPPELVDEMAKDPEAFSLEGESREMTVLFSDVRGFTNISEGLDPKQLTQLMNEYLTPMTHVIHQHRGTIDKYMGDAIMAFWGAPLHDEQHARHALQTALGMLESLSVLQEQFRAKGWPTINIGIGLNTGPMTVGNMGSEFRMAYTVMGDAVNLGSRLEGLTKEYGVKIIVSEFTRTAVPDFVFRDLDLVRVKGKDKPVGIYEPICPVGEDNEQIMEELALYGEALALYRAQQWSSAEEKFSILKQRYPERYLYDLYTKRIAYFREYPPGAGWDGAFTFKTK